MNVEVRANFLDNGNIISIVSEITERKKIENELRSTKEDYKRLFEDHSAIKLLINPETGDIYDANTAAAEYYGWTCEELRKKNISEINVSFLSQNENLQALRNLRNQKKYHFEFKHVKADGTIRDVSVYGSAIRFAGKKYLHAIVFDITERKKAQEELRKTYQLLNSISENSTDAIYVKDLNGKYLWFNKELEKRTGKDRTEVIGKDDYFLFPPEQAERIIEGDKQVIESGKPMSFEGSISTVNGLETHHSIRGPIYDQEGKMTGIYGISRDITERKNAEIALKQSEKKLKHSEVIAKIGYWELKLDEGLIYSSEGARKIYGTEKEIFSAEEVKSFQLPEYCGMLDEALRALVKENQPYDVEFKIKRANDGAVIDIHSNAVYHAGTRTIFGVIQDITEQKRAERRFS